MKWSWAALAVLLALAYPAALGPVAYADIRGWLPPGTYDKVSAPAWAVVRRFPAVERPYNRFTRWWVALAFHHNHPDNKPQAD